ncbi:MAG: glycosyltransferase [Anaerolineae bacterium]|nr:glycosyltransferase [Anaerolineae bacterium]
MLISLIATVLNEGESIHRLMGSLAAQTRLPDEVVIVDGGSHDDTVAIIQSYADKLPLRVLIEPGCNISAGRNRAIAAAQGDIIAATDAGVELAPDWLEKLTRPLVENPAMQVVGGFFHAEATNLFELAMGATVLPLVDEIHPATFLPSSRSIAFRKSAWAAVGGYPEWLDYCEDLIFDLRLKAVSHQLPVVSHQREIRSENSVLSTQYSVLPFAFVPDAIVHFRPRGSLRSFFKQYYLYARGDGKADLWRKRHAARYITYLVAVPAVFLLGLLIHPLLWLLYLPGAYVYLRQPYHRLKSLQRSVTSYQLLVASHQTEIQARNSKLSTLYLFALIPVIRVVGDIAKMIGYPVGWVWRLRHHPPDWRISQAQKSP